MIPPPRAARCLAFAYGLLCYAIHWSAIIYTVGFIANVWFAKTIDAGGPPGQRHALAVDVALLIFFIVPHWVMAQGWFKRWWQVIVPPPIERSTYVLTASALLGFLFWVWRPMPHVIWDAPLPIGIALTALYWLGWALAIGATFPIDHWDLFGLRQVYLYLLGRDYSPPTASDSWLYRVIPHPIFVGYAVAVWSTPKMTLGHLLLAGSLSAFLALDVWHAGLNR